MSENPNAVAGKVEKSHRKNPVEKSQVGENQEFIFLKLSMMKS